MLNDETLKEIGRFAIEFNNLDEVITAMAGAIIECAEWDIARHVATEWGTNGRRLTLIQEVCKKLATKHGILKTAPHDALLRHIGLARKLGEKRNLVIHGELKFERNKKPIAQLKNVQEMSPDALSELAKTCELLADRLINAYYDFMDAVERERSAAAGS